MDQYATDIGHDALPDLEWHAIDGVSMFLRVPRQVMESLAADHKPTLDLVPMSVSLLRKHCNDNELKLNRCIAAYLNPQIPKPTNWTELKFVLDFVRNSLQRRYSADVSSRQSIEQEVAGNSLFAVMFQPQRGVSGNGNEVDWYLSIGVVKSSGFIDILSWWLARKELLPNHYQMAMDYHETPATLTPTERVNNAASREFTCT
ncbi:unnamed protein product [Sphagnum balticum]